MPTYLYEREDGTHFELEQKITDEPLKTCPETGQNVKRLISGGSFQLKGSGWYKTDYASSGSSSSNGDKGSNGGSGSGGCGGGGCGGGGCH